MTNLTYDDQCFRQTYIRIDYLNAVRVNQLMLSLLTIAVQLKNHLTAIY